MPCNAGHAGSFCEGSLDLCIICGGSDKDWMPEERIGRLVVASWDIYGEQQGPMAAWSRYVIPVACLPGIYS
jgi:hypothetical protein